MYAFLFEKLLIRISFRTVGMTVKKTLSFPCKKKATRYLYGTQILSFYQVTDEISELKNNLVLVK